MPCIKWQAFLQDDGVVVSNRKEGGVAVDVDGSAVLVARTCWVDVRLMDETITGSAAGD